MQTDGDGPPAKLERAIKHLELTEKKHRCIDTEMYSRERKSEEDADHSSIRFKFSFSIAKECCSCDIPVCTYAPDRWESV